MEGVTYPMAYSRTERAIIRIVDAPRKEGERYSCVQCNQRMSAVVRVSRITPHFRHTRLDLEIHCDRDTALHFYAIKMIQQAHAKAQKTGSEYMMTRRGIRCESCGQNYATEVNLADGWECESEKSIVPRTRSDLVFAHPDGRRIVVEVVNTHEMEPETKAAYQSEGIPVAIVQVAWNTIERLLGRLDIHDSQNFDIDICAECEARRRDVEEQREREERREREEEESEAPLRDHINRFLSRMERRQSRRIARHSTETYLSSINRSSIFRHPAEMYPSTRSEDSANAIILTELGFRQWRGLFYLEIYERRKVYLVAELVNNPAAIRATQDYTVKLSVEGGLYEGWTDSRISRYALESAGRRLQQFGVFGVDVRTEVPAPRKRGGGL